MIRRPPRSTLSSSSAASDVYKRQVYANDSVGNLGSNMTNFTIVKTTYIPPVPTINTVVTGNFWVNTTWNAGSGNRTDSYNVSVNGIWTYGTILYTSPS